MHIKEFIKKICIVLLYLVTISFAKAQIPVDFSGLDKQSGSAAVVNGKLLEVSWPTGETEKGKIIINLEKEMPLIRSIQLSGEGVNKEIATDLEPAFILTVGKRDLVSQNGWNIFFDKTAYLPYTSYPVVLEKREAKVTSDGSQTRITISNAIAATFAGPLEITLYRGSALINIAAVLVTQTDSLAIIYDAGLVSKKIPGRKYSGRMNTIICNLQMLPVMKKAGILP